MTPEAHALRDEITQWCVNHKTDQTYQAHMNYDVRSRIVDSWVLSHGGLLLIPEPTDGTAYFLDSSSNQVVIRQSMTTSPLELFHRMAILQWSGLVGGDLPSRNLERNFYMITKLDALGVPKEFGWEPQLVSHFPDFGAFGYEAILDNLFTGYRDSSHAHTRPFRASEHRVTVPEGGTETVQLKVKGGTPPYSFAVIGGGTIIAVNQRGLVTVNMPAGAAGAFLLWVIITDSADRRTQSALYITVGDPATSAQVTPGTLTFPRQFFEAEEGPPAEFFDLVAMGGYPPYIFEKVSPGFAAITVVGSRLRVAFGRGTPPSTKLVTLRCTDAAGAVVETVFSITPTRPA